MNISIMSKKYINVEIEAHDKTKVGDEMILYFENINKIIVMNETTSVIWNFIISNLQNDKDVNIAADDILEEIKAVFTEEIPNDQDIISDIYDTISEFIENKILTCDIIENYTCV